MFIKSQPVNYQNIPYFYRMTDRQTEIIFAKVQITQIRIFLTFNLYQELLTLIIDSF